MSNSTQRNQTAAVVMNAKLSSAGAAKMKPRTDKRSVAEAEAFGIAFSDALNDILRDEARANAQ